MSEKKATAWFNLIGVPTDRFVDRAAQGADHLASEACVLLRRVSKTEATRERLALLAEARVLLKGALGLVEDHAGPKTLRQVQSDAVCAPPAERTP